MFEWDEDKNLHNIGKHGVSFEIASRIFEGFVFTVTDSRFDYGEVREISIGAIGNLAVLTVVHTDRDGRKRIISARPRAVPKGTVMKTKYKKELSAEELAALRDEDIDFSDIPELGENFWREARLVEPDRTQPVTIRVKKSVLDTYKSLGKGYQTRMNAVLESYAKTLKK
jgi:uncharacterized DUF497 family protein/uncharacterized protein (DUF4415 family)